MGFETQSLKVGGEIVRIVELVVPRCVLFYGNNPCTAGARAANHPNLIQQSEVWSSAQWGGTFAIRTNSVFIAPNSTLTGVLMVDSNNVSALTMQVNINSNEPNFAALPASAWLDLSLHVLKKPGSEPSVMMRAHMYDGVSSADLRMTLDALTGCWSARHATTLYVPLEAAKIVDCGSWWRMHMRWNRSSCNSITLVFYPAAQAAGVLSLGVVSTEIGSAGFWGAQLHSSGHVFQPYLTRGVESQWLTTGLAQACHQTGHTCSALSAYLAGEQSIFFVDEKVDLPIGLSAFPALVKVSLTPSRLNPQAGVGESAKLSVDLRDFTYDDANMDPYVDARSYDPSSQGTFFGRFFARDPYLQGKKIRYHEGYYAGSGTFTFSHYITREYIVDDIDRPDAKGRVRIRGTDVLRLTNGDRALCPIPSTATLRNNMTAVDTAVFLPSSADAADLVGEAHVRIDDEIFALVTQTGCRWTTTRGAGFSTVEVHSAGSVVQKCQTYSYMNVCSICMDLIVNKARISSSYIPVTSWDAEKAATLTTYNLYNIISVPTPVRDLLQDIMRTCDLSIWNDETVSKISLRHQSPWAVPAIVLSDSAHFIGDTMVIRGRDDIKVSRFGIRYAPTDYASDGGEFSRYQMSVNSLREDTRFDGQRSEYIVETTWLTASHDALAATIAGRGMLRYSELAPMEAQFQGDASIVASVKTGHVVELLTRMLQDVDGSMKSTRMQVIESGPEIAGHSYRYNALLYQGLTAAASLAIDVSTHNYNVHSALGGPATAVRVYLTVGSGVVVGGSGTDQVAITTSGLPAGSALYLNLVGSCQVLGFRGESGIGAQGNAHLEDGEWLLINPGGAPEPGGPGGHALYVADGVAAYIDVSGGYLFAGGPGGGGGGLYWDGASYVEDGGDGGGGQGYTNSGGPSAPDTVGVLDGGLGAVWGGTATDGEDGNEHNGAAAGAQGYAVKLQSASAVYFFTGGYDSSRVKGLVGV